MRGVLIFVLCWACSAHAQGGATSCASGTQGCEPQSRVFNPSLHPVTHRDPTEVSQPSFVTPEATSSRSSFATSIPVPSFEPYVESPGGRSQPPPNNDYFDVNSLAARGIFTVEQFTQQLPDVFRRRFLLLRNSKSTHKADEKNPRVVMFNYDHKGRSTENHPMEMIAFSTHPNDPSKEIVERIKYNPSTFSFEFSAIDFSVQPPVNYPTTSCKGCHSDYLRPNWDPGHNWPNAFGTREKFSPHERRQVSDLVNTHPRLNGFKLADQLREGEQTPGTVMFYGLFGPTQHFVTNKFVQNPRYKTNRTSLLKVLAGCTREIDTLLERAPNVLATVEQAFQKGSPEFKFPGGENPVLNRELLRSLAALQALFRSDTDNMAWFGKTRKISQLYSHLFYKLDHEMLIGTFCDRDPEVRALLESLGATGCQQRNQSTQKICDVPDGGMPELWPAKAPEPSGPAAPNLKFQECTVPSPTGGERKTFCVKPPGSDSVRPIWWGDNEGLYYCPQENADGTCRGPGQPLDKNSSQRLLERYLEMEKRHQETKSFGEETFRDAQHRQIAEKAFRKLTGTTIEQAVASGKVVLTDTPSSSVAPTAVPTPGMSPTSSLPPFPGAVDVIRCLVPVSSTQRIRSLCVMGADRTLKAIRWDEGLGVVVCERWLPNGGCQGARFSLDGPMSEKLVAQLVGLERSGAYRDANHRALVARVVRRLTGHRIEDLVSGAVRWPPAPVATPSIAPIPIPSVNIIPPPEPPKFDAD